MKTDNQSQKAASARSGFRSFFAKNTNISIALVAAPVLTLGAVGVGVAQSDVTQTGTPVALQRNAAAAAIVDRAPKFDRSADRAVDAAVDAVAEASKELPPRQKLTRWSTDDLRIRETPTDGATVVKTVPVATRLIATGRTQGAFSEVNYQNAFRWVSTEYLATKKPKVEKPKAEAADASGGNKGLTMAACPNGSVENGLTPDAVKVYRAVCNNFPQITSYGGWDPHGEHTSGRAIDIMTSDVALGTEIAEFLRANAAELNLYDVIWRQRIWTPVRASEGWRSMSDRGSATANHYDHVHVAVN